jgi:hypothetical protein
MDSKIKKKENCWKKQEIENLSATNPYKKDTILEEEEEEE